MAKYRILIKPSAVKEIEAIPLKKDRRRIADLIRRLAENPRPSVCEKLSGQDKYLIRQGRYRIVYSIEDQDLIVYAIRAWRIGQRARSQESEPEFRRIIKTTVIPAKAGIQWSLDYRRSLSRSLSERSGDPDSSEMRDQNDKHLDRKLIFHGRPLFLYAKRETQKNKGVPLFSA